jgi:hypothetical protein
LDIRNKGIQGVRDFIYEKYFELDSQIKLIQAKGNRLNKESMQRLNNYEELLKKLLEAFDMSRTNMHETNNGLDKIINIIDKFKGEIDKNGNSPKNRDIPALASCSSPSTKARDTNNRILRDNHITVDLSLGKEFSMEVEEAEAISVLGYRYPFWFLYQDADLSASSSLVNAQDKLIKRMEGLSLPSKLDELDEDYRRKRIIAFEDSLLQLLDITGFFLQHTVVYPAGGIDILFAKYIDTVILDEVKGQRLSAIAEDLFADLKDNLRRRLKFSEEFAAQGKIMRIDALRPVLYYCWAFPQLTKYKTVVLKGFQDCVRPEPMQMRYFFADLDNYYLDKGDRILVLNNNDARQASRYLNKNNYRILDNWLAPEHMDRLRQALTLMDVLV